jgi:hypothetical protein
MEKDDPTPETKPAGNKPPPRPPHRTAVGLGPDGDDFDKKCHVTIQRHRRLAFAFGGVQSALYSDVEQKATKPAQ